MHKKTLEFIKKLVRLSHHERIAIACSGGADSTALVLLLCASNINKRNCYMLHLNHQLRPEANAEEKQINALALRLHIHYAGTRKNVLLHAQKKKMSVEAAARDLRYAFFQAIMKKKNIPHLVLAHHIDDQAETIIFNFIRGSGMQGMCGMHTEKSMNGIIIHRPLLYEKKSALIAYLKRKKQMWCEDSSNQDTVLWRNRIRHKIIPLIKTINPHIEQTLMTMSRLFQENIDDERSDIESVYHSCAVSVTKKQIILNSHKLYLVRISMQRKVIRYAIERLKGNLVNISGDFIENFIRHKLNTIYYNDRGHLQARKVRI